MRERRHRRKKSDLIPKTRWLRSTPYIPRHPAAAYREHARSKRGSPVRYAIVVAVSSWLEVLLLRFRRNRQSTVGLNYVVVSYSVLF